MKFLKALATPFIAIWRWIKETAWVQPLLIVGIIFGIIFSIPAITNWVKSWNFGSDTYKYLQNQQLSLEGITGDENKGQAKDFVKAFDTARNEFEQGNRAAARAALKDYAGDDGKMFLFFVKENSDAGDLNEATKFLAEEEWDTKVVKEHKKLYGESSAPAAFKFKTIFTDQKITVDEKDHTYDEHTPFEIFTIDRDYSRFAINAASSAVESNYYLNFETASEKSSYKNKADKIPEGSSESLPYYVLIDLTDLNQTDNIITSVFFSVNGSDKYEKSTFLAQAWIYDKDFKNPSAK